MVLVPAIALVQGATAELIPLHLDAASGPTWRYGFVVPHLQLVHTQDQGSWLSIMPL